MSRHSCGRVRSVVFLFVLAFSAVLFQTMAQAPRTIGEHVWDTILETPHPYPPGEGVDGEPVWTQRYRHPNAAYLVFEFKRFDLAPGDRVEVRDPQRKQVHVYTGKGFKEKGGDFVTKMILGSEAIIELYAGNRQHDHYGYRIERITRGYSQSELQELYGIGATRAICGSDDKEDAVCYETSFPEVYDKSRAVARIVMDGSALCTAWLVSCENHVMTNNHCTWDDSDFDTQGELDRMEFQFMYQDDTCGGGGSSIEYSFMGGTWLENDRNLDYTLIQAPAEEDPASVYGWLLIDDRLVDIDEQIYIVGHPSGRPKEISLYSTDATDQDNPDGFCEVFTQTAPVCVGGSVPEIGYYCDTEGGNSGSPVLSRETNKVVALHHCANCPNRGVRIQNVLQANLAGSNPLPACSLFDDAGAVALDAAAYACSSTATIEVNDGSLRGTGSVDVRIWSDSEPEAETVTLGETGSDSGRFVGAFALASSTAVAGDGVLSVFDGDSVTVQYIDADDGQGGTDIVREDSAVVDCQAPTISDVQSGAVTGQSAVISWRTNEPADSEVSYSISPPEWSTTGDPELVTDHAVTLDGLDACSIYQFWVSSTDWTGNAVASDNDGALFSFETGIDNILETTSTDTPIPIVDNTTFTSEVTIDSTETVLDVDVRLNATHTYDGDLDIFLIGPDGTRVELTSDNGGTGENFVNTVFDDEADVSIVGSSAPFTGRFRPEGSLASLDGQPAAGVWTLEVTDDAGADQGELIDWAPILTFEARDCGAVGEFAAYELATDTCSTDATGSGNGRWESGEKIELRLDVRNAGTDPLTDAWVRVRPLTSGVVMLDDSATVGTLAPGATGSTRSPHVIVYLEQSLDCGAMLEFEVEVFANEGSWPAGFQQVLGEPVAEDSGITLSEKFTGGIPIGWSVVDGSADGATWFADSASDPAGCGSPDPGTPILGSWAAVDSSCTTGGTRMDEELITPVMSFVGQPIVTLEFDHWFEWNPQRTDEIADVDVRSSLTGGQWVNLARFTGASTANPAHETIDLSSFAGDAIDVEIRWHYYDAQRDSYWYVDNVDVSYRVPAVCFNQTCPAPTAVPSPIPDGSSGTSPLRADRVVADGSRILLAWDDQCLPSGAKLIYGPLDQVATYSVSGAVCDVATPESWDAVPEGDLYFLLLGSDAAGVESSWGTATDGERNGLTPSYTCGDIAKEMTGSCP